MAELTERQGRLYNHSTCGSGDGPVEELMVEVRAFWPGLTWQAVLCGDDVEGLRGLNEAGDLVAMVRREMEVPRSGFEGIVGSPAQSVSLFATEETVGEVLVRLDEQLEAMASVMALVHGDLRPGPPSA